jgi:hypothetical protein
MEHLHKCITLVDNHEAVVDYCQECKTKLTYKKCRYSGRIDNKKYREEHKRDFLQRYDKLYKKYYPENGN